MRAGEREAEEGRAARRELERLQTFDRLRIDKFNSFQYIDVGEMSVQCKHGGAMHWSAEKVVSSSEQSTQFSNLCQERWFSLILFSDPPPLLVQMLTGSRARDSPFKQNIRENNSALSMGALTAISVNKRPGTSSFNKTFTLHGHIYHFIGALTPVALLRPAFIPVYIFYSD